MKPILPAVLAALTLAAAAGTGAQATGGWYIGDRYIEAAGLRAMLEEGEEGEDSCPGSEVTDVSVINFNVTPGGTLIVELRIECADGTSTTTAVTVDTGVGHPNAGYEDDFPDNPTPPPAQSCVGGYYTDGGYLDEVCP